MRLTRIERANEAAEIWEIPRGRPITPAQVDEYRARYSRLSAAYWANYAAQLAHDAVLASKHARRRGRAAWLRRRLKLRGPAVVNAWHRGVVPIPFEMMCERYRAQERSAPGVYVVPVGAPDKRGLAIHVLGDRGELLLAANAFGTSAQQAAAINHAFAYYDYQRSQLSGTRRVARTRTA
jgi:hypothetical protein